VIVQTEVNETSRFERTLTVRLENEELESAKKKAAAKISRNMKIKGFRPGKAPLAVVERAAGADYVRSEAIDEAIQDVVPRAIDEAGLDPVTPPAVSAVRDESEDGTIEIDVLVTLWPVLESLPDFGEIEIEVEDPAVTDDELEEQLDALRNQYAELVDHEGELSEGDFALIDLDVESDGEPVETAGAKDLMYEIGTNSFVSGMDELLVGAAAGDTVRGAGELPDGYSDKGGETVELIVTIKEAKKKTLPDITDEMVSDGTEFETEDELRAAITENMLAYKVHNQRVALQDKVVQYILNELDLDIPAALVDAEVQARVRNLATRLEQDNIDLQNYLRITGQDEASFLASIRDQAEHALATRVLLDSIAAIENFEVTDDEIAEHVTAMFQGSDDDSTEIVEAWQATGEIESLMDDMLRERALTSLVDSAKAVDKEGNPVDLTPVVIEPKEQEPEEQEPEEDATDEVEDSSEASDDDAPNESEETS
jgi:trigger factor